MVISKSQESNTQISNIDLSRLLPPPNISAPEYIPSPEAHQPAPPSKSSSSTKRTSKRRGNKATAIIGSCAGVAVVILLICGGLFSAGLVFASIKATATVEGYAVQAYGRKAINPINNLSSAGESIINPFTSSEFGIITIKSTTQGMPMTPEVYLAALTQANAIVEQSSVQRAGMSGIRYKAKSVGIVPAHIAEVFTLGNKVLVTMYVNGFDKRQHDGRRQTGTYESCYKSDKPEDFFATLTNVGQ
jgi:hypothetical protein